MKILVLHFGVLALFLLAGCGEKEPEDHEIMEHMESVEWEQRLILSREEKDRMFAGKSSPLPRADRFEFAGLRYYQVDSNYRLAVQFEPFKIQDTMKMGTSTGEAREMIRLGMIHFVIDKEHCRLTLYKSLNKEAGQHLFIPFGDQTNGSDTYEGGRYLDVPEELIYEQAILDLNEAYNPYCAYNASWSCPIVPAENILAVSIRVGEKTYREE